ncbi:MAG: NAD(P)/FAD-dependent oxidoreductase [Burkholderiaceae bacterium]
MSDPQLPPSKHDVLIAGGGLAGLTLALQLKDAMPGLDVRVIERRAGAAPAATHKIGESSVEIGAHYFADTLGLRDHLDAKHLRKFGFRFFFSEGESDLDGVTELGASRFMSTPSWQIDRGIFENFLGEEAVRRGARYDTGAVVKRIELLPAGHRVEVEHEGRRETIVADWLIDASGRAGLLKRKLDLAERNAHDANAVWFRLSERLEIDTWVDDPAWRARCSPSARWMSTNHLCGPGYWLWLIPLGSGAHSVGIVADAAMHPLNTMDTFDKAMAWISCHQPAVHIALTKVFDAKPDVLMDFAYFKDFSYGCRQTFSDERWALTGEAGWFLDPFYSPGSDFIAIGNTFITELIRSERSGASIRTQSLFYGELFRSFYESTLTLYQDQYHLFGNARVMPVKVLWDYTYYWGVLCQLFFQKRLTDRAAIVALAEPLRRATRLNASVQKVLHDWGMAAAPANGGGAMLDQASLPWFAELNRGLRDVLDDEAFRRRILTNVDQLESLAAEIVAMATADGSQIAAVAPDATSMLFGMAA